MDASTLSSTITTKGQTTVPQAVREALHADIGAQLVWHLMPDGSVLVRAKNKSLLDMAGSLKPAKGAKVKISDMNAWA